MVARSGGRERKRERSRKKRKGKDNRKRDYRVEMDGAVDKYLYFVGINTTHKKKTLYMLLDHSVLQVCRRISVPEGLIS